MSRKELGLKCASQLGESHKCNARICRRWRVSMGATSDSDETIFVTERVGVVGSNMGKSSFMVPLTFHTEYSPVITTQLDTGATCSAMSYTDLLNI